MSCYNFPILLLINVVKVLLCLIYKLYLIIGKYICMGKTGFGTILGIGITESLGEYLLKIMGNTEFLWQKHNAHLLPTLCPVCHID